MTQKKAYNHLTLKERYYIQHYLKLGMSVASIAEALNRAKSTIHREINKCIFKSFYNPYMGAIVYLRLRQARVHNNTINRNENLKDFILKNLAVGVSPNTIADFLREKYPKFFVSASTIYRYVNGDYGKMLELKQYLPTQRIKQEKL